MAKYRKFIVAAVLMFGYIALKYYNLLPAGIDRVVVDSLAAAVTAAAVYQVPNGQ